MYTFHNPTDDQKLLPAQLQVVLPYLPYSEVGLLSGTGPAIDLLPLLRLRAESSYFSFNFVSVENPHAETLRLRSAVRDARNQDELIHHQHPSWLEDLRSEIFESMLVYREGHYFSEIHIPYKPEKEGGIFSCKPLWDPYLKRYRRRMPYLETVGFDNGVLGENVYQMEVGVAGSTFEGLWYILSSNMGSFVLNTYEVTTAIPPGMPSPRDPQSYSLPHHLFFPTTQRQTLSNTLHASVSSRSHVRRLNAFGSRIMDVFNMEDVGNMCNGRLRNS